MRLFITLKPVLILSLFHRNCNSSVGISTRLQAAWPINRHSNPGKGNSFFCCSIFRPAMGPTQHNETQGPIPQKETFWGVKLTTHLHLVPRLWKSGTKPPLLHNNTSRESCTVSHSDEENCLTSAEYLKINMLYILEVLIQISSRLRHNPWENSSLSKSIVVCLSQ
jgi:hypothetical protein